MHEFSIAASIVESVLDFVEAHRARQVLVVRLRVGELTCVAVEQLQFCYESITRETAAADSVLEIDRVEASIQCPHCAYAGRPKYWEEAAGLTPVVTLECPRCGRTAEAAEGHECTIQAIQYVN